MAFTTFNRYMEDLSHFHRERRRCESSFSQSLDCDHIYVLEISNTRLETYLPDSVVIHYRDQFLLYTKIDPMQRLSSAYHKYISRVFHVNHYARDIPYLLTGLQSIIKTQCNDGDIYLRIQTFPSVLADAVRDVIHSSTPAYVHVDGITDVNNHREEDNTHLLQIVYSAGEAIFRYGLHATFIEPPDRTADSDGMPVICRAQHKLTEVFQMVIPYYFNDNSFHESLKDSLACDVGGAPGGWTLYLSTLCDYVLSIDPAELHDAVLKRDNVKHIRNILQHPSVDQEILQAMHTEKKVRQLRVIACDVNFDAKDAAVALQPILARLHGFNRSMECKASWYILTLKLLKGPRPRHIEQARQAVQNILITEHQAASAACKHGCSCWHFECTHLAANTKNERTLICRLH